MEKPSLRIVDALLKRGRAETCATDAPFGAWRDAFEQESLQWSDTMDRSLAGGFISDRPAYAFAAGYQCAIARLVPALPRGRVTAICVSEAGGVHPRAIQTALAPDPRNGSPGTWILNGRKSFVTAADLAEVLLVAATIGPDAAGRPIIKLVSIHRNDPGVDIRMLDPLPFIPEIRHGEVLLQDVRLPSDRVLAGDGYADYVKPFRTIEDLHVLSAICGYLLGCAFRFGWPPAVSEMAAAQALLLKTVADGGIDTPEGHVTLAGALAFMDRLVEFVDPMWESADAASRDRWRRDRPLLRVAAEARRRRRESAWKFYREEK